MSKQLDDKGREAMARNIRARIDAATEQIDKILTASKAAGNAKLNDKDKVDAMYLHGRIEELQISYRLAFNTEWVESQREKRLAKIIAALAEKNEPRVIERLKKHQAFYERNKKCNKCGGRGFNGINTSTGEFNLCRCVTNSLEAWH